MNRSSNHPRLGRRDFLKGSMGFAVAAMASAGCRSHGKHTGRAGRVIILCIDGMDYALTRKFMLEGRLPNCAALSREGSFVPMTTCMPPLSPVCWTSMATGLNPGEHGVYDFLRRDPAKVREGFLPEDGVTRSSKSWAARISGGSGESRVLLRRGETIWESLAKAGFPAVAYKMPGNYPVRPSKAKVLSGMGTPDLTGTSGSYTYFSSDPNDWLLGGSGGRVVRVREEAGVLEPLEHGVVDLVLLEGAPESQNAGQRHRPVCLDVSIDRNRKTAAIVVQDQHVVLREGQWSEWVRLHVPMTPPLQDMHGAVRFYLKETGEHVKIFASPVNLAPGTPGIASGNLDAELESAYGLYYTKGMSEQTKALSAGVLTFDEYITQSNLVFAERAEAIDHLVRNVDRGLLCLYVSSLDLDCHVMWHHYDPEHPAHRVGHTRYADFIPERYEDMDGVIGHVRSQMHPKDQLYVISDHGFTSFRRQFNLVRWLELEGYLAYQSRLKRRLSTWYDGIDWSRTRAYGIGFAGLCINLRGREANGCVGEQEREALIDEIHQKLLDVRDTDGSAVFGNVYRASKIYHGQAIAQAPDMILGYARGYGPANASVEGSWTETLLTDRLDGFTGSHCVDSELVPGVCFSTRELTVETARLEDMAPTVLLEFAQNRPARMAGRPLY